MQHLAVASDASFTSQPESNGSDKSCQRIITQINAELARRGATSSADSSIVPISAPLSAWAAQYFPGSLARSAVGACQSLTFPISLTFHPSAMSNYVIVFVAK